MMSFVFISRTGADSLMDFGFFDILSAGRVGRNVLGYKQ